MAVPAAARALVDHLGLQGEPAHRARRLDHVGLVRGRLRLAAAPRAERDDGGGGGERLQPVHVPHQGTESRVPHPVQHGVPGPDRAGGRANLQTARRRARHLRLAAHPAAAGRRRDDLLRHQYLCDRHGDRADDPAVDLQGLEREFPLECAELFRGRARCGPRRLDDARTRPLAGRAGGGAALPDLPHLQGLSRSNRRRAAPRARDGGPAPRDDRSAGAGHRRQGPDVAVAHPARAALCDGGRARARHEGQRDPGREDRGAAARHRQARGARAHSFQAGPADARRVPEDSCAPEGRRRHRQLRPVPVPGCPADPEPPRALGRQRLSVRTQGRGDSRSARASCRWSTTSTR